ncbi:MAG: site-2 protease family protein [Bacteroidetes bacterium]|nr:site-2 protease family protein [Bacteroidota bacterium]
MKNIDSPGIKKLFIHLILFILTLITTTLAGSEWIHGRFFFDNLGWMDWQEFLKGLQYSIPFLGILTVHEFGHYFTARFYKIKVSLPYFIPFFFGLGFSIGTFGAFIRIKSRMKHRKHLFDVGIAGPLAGFVVAIMLLFYGFTHLPPPKYIFNIHTEYILPYIEVIKKENPELYKKITREIIAEQKILFNVIQYYPELNHEEQEEIAIVLAIEKFINNPKEFKTRKGLLSEIRTVLNKFDYSYIVYKNTGGSLALGSNLIFMFFERFVVEDPRLIPNKYEMWHYPFLLAGYLALFFTALNLIPIGQLDGGHILYGLVGSKNHSIISPILFLILVFYAGLGLVELFDKINIFGFPIYSAPLYWGGLCVLFSKVFKGFYKVMLFSLAFMALQFSFSNLFPTVKGYPGWLFFALLLSMLGVYHPPAQYEKPLNTKRKILGWISLIIFILCFTPVPLVLE